MSITTTPSFADLLAERGVQGVGIVDGCCCSTPEHVAAVARALGR